MHPYGARCEKRKRWWMPLGQRVRPQFSLTLYVIALLLALVSGSAAVAADTSWWADMQGEAQREGYKLLHDEPQQVPDTALIVDVRPAYEYEAGHIERAVNVEFPPTDIAGDRALVQEASAAVEALVSGDHRRQIVIYCRSFR